ncbi:hypothetical protein MPF19_06010 [Polaribacter sp. Z014]|uniref:hypothetical protein n=1 Tax=Polaribacter sp. Z014 TaxID=2927126 RepID=UPI0020218568|nr:hypothetical protein [Polaribacter sp. Z014]MCL7762966.1 hypothetical protein [Polaribacter sp. Z014]
MKKILLTLVLVVAFSTTYGQNKYQERQNKYFVEAAAKEYNLNDAQQKELTELRTTMVVAYGESQKAAKAGTITKEEKQAKNGEASKAFNRGVIKLTGKNYKELAPFFKRMRDELKKVK